MPDVTIIIPTYNRAQFVGLALASVLEGQSGVATEIIVVNDASTDTTQRVLEHYVGQIRVVALTQNQGASVARNAGMELATGRYVKFLDSDDVLCPGTLVDEVRIADDTQADMVLSGWGTARLDAGGKPVADTERLSEPPDMHPLPDTLLLGRAAMTSAVLYRRQYIQGLSWDPAIRHPDDWHFFCQAGLKCGTVVTRLGQAYWHRVHDGPRASMVDILNYAHGHHYVLRLLEETLASQGNLTVSRKKLLADYYYKQIYVLAMHDRQAFEKTVAHILCLDPKFQPRAHEPRAYMRILARWIGFRRAVLLYTLLKRCLRRGKTGLGSTSIES